MKLMKSLVLKTCGLYLLVNLVIQFSGCKSEFKPMDVNGEGRFDTNLFLENPNWQFRLTNNNNPDQTKLCPVNSDNPQDWKNSATCTSQDVYINKATGWNLFICNFVSGAISGHMNWFPIKYDGTIFWSDKSGDDDDYNFKMVRKDKALFTGTNNHLALEFDSDETVDHWNNTGTSWERFHHEIDNDERNGSILIDNKFAIVLGLLGIDGGHTDFSPELHPVYALFIHTKDDPTDDRWSFFIRNWGDEGYCSSNQEYVYRNAIQMIIPHENFDDVELTSNTNIWESNPDPSMSFSKVKHKDGLLLTFTFNDPEKKGCFFGDLGIRWKGPNVAPRNDFKQNPLENSSSPSSMKEMEFQDEAFSKKMSQLDKSSKKELDRLLSREIVSEKYRLYPQSRVARVTKVLEGSPVKLDSIQNKISELNRKKMLPDYRAFVRSVPDSATFIRKKMRQDLIAEYLKNKGIE